MALVDEASTVEVGRTFADLVGGDPAVRRLWVRPHHGWIELRVLTTPTDLDARHRLYGATLPLFDQLPDDHAPRLFVLDPQDYDDLGPTVDVPANAVEIPLRQPPG